PRPDCFRRGPGSGRGAIHGGPATSPERPYAHGHTDVHVHLAADSTTEPIVNPLEGEPLSNLEYHALLALADRPLYGYALRAAVETESDGAHRRPAGSLYRALARLMTRGVVQTTEPDGPVERHAGLERRYYALTPRGRRALEAETARLRRAALLAAQRLGLVDRAP